MRREHEKKRKERQGTSFARHLNTDHP